jgi:hypothetical protein
MSIVRIVIAVVVFRVVFRGHVIYLYRSKADTGSKYTTWYPYPSFEKQSYV